MIKPIAFIDMDGVLCDLERHFIDKFGTTLSMPPGYDPYAGKNWGKSLYEVLINRESFFKLIDNLDFWSIMPWTHDGKELLGKIEEVFGRENCYILSAPTKDASSGGKINWLKDNMPDYWENRRYIFTKQKWVCAGPGRYLFDDDTHNCKLFESHPNVIPGGKCCVINRPWNYGYTKPVIIQNSWSDVKYYCDLKGSQINTCFAGMSEEIVNLLIHIQNRPTSYKETNEVS